MKEIRSFDPRVNEILNKDDNALKMNSEAFIKGLRFIRTEEGRQYDDDDLRMMFETGVKFGIQLTLEKRRYLVVYKSNDGIYSQEVEAESKADAMDIIKGKFDSLYYNCVIMNIIEL